MKRYLVALLATAMLLPLIVAPGRASYSGKNKSQSKVSPESLFVNKAAQPQQEAEQQTSAEPIVGKAVNFAISKAVRDLPPANQRTGRQFSVQFEEDEENENEEEPRVFYPGQKSTPDGALQRYAPRTQAANAAQEPDAPPAPTVNFDGLSNQDNFNAFGGRVSPPDTVGDVGPNHYVQMTNLMFRVWNKTGTALTSPAKVSSLFAPLGSPCGPRDDGDPIVVYDDLADRWVLTQFCLPQGSATPPFHQLMAISTTSDPTGTYYLYDFITPGINFEDYPKFGVWPDGYYMTAPQFPSTGGFAAIGVFAYDRERMLEGNPAATFIYIDTSKFPFVDVNTVTRMLPSHADGLVPPPPGTPNYILNFGADEFGDPAGDVLHIYEFHADFLTPANSTFTERPGSPLAVASFDPTLRELNDGVDANLTVRDDIDQPGAAANAKLDSLSNRPMMQLQYRNFGSYESLVLNHTVDVNATPPTSLTGHRAGIRYYQLQRNLAGGNFTVAEQSTFAGALGDTDHRWMGSAAMNWQGDLAVGYSVSGTTTFPSVRYAGRLGTDAPNGLTLGEQTMVAGSGIQTNSGSRWGDYSAMSVDPSDDCSFWYTQEYYTSASQATSSVGWLTRIGKFQLGTCTTSPRGTIQGQVTSSATGLPIANAKIVTADGYTRFTDGSGNYSLTPVAPGSYNMTASAHGGYMPAGASGVTVTNGGTTIQNFVLTPGAEITLGSAAFSEGPFSDHNNFIEPGETAQVTVTLNNPGAVQADNVVGRLSIESPVPSLTFANGGIISFGNIPAGGSAQRTFRFIVSKSALQGLNYNLVLRVDFLNGTSPVAFELTTLVGQLPITEPTISTALDATPATSGATYTASSGTQTGRITRNGVVSSCGTTLSNPGLQVATGSRRYDAYVYTNNTAFPQCVTVSVVDSTGSLLGTVAYNNSGFVPSNPSTNFMASWPFTNPIAPYSFTVAPGQNFTVVVHDINASSTTVIPYTLTITRQPLNNTLVRRASDFSPDLKSDAAVWRPSNGTWYYLDSSTSTIQTKQWGISTDKIVPGDYDGDGAADFAVFRPAEGNWYIANSFDGTNSLKNWGASTDIPVPGDYDGDGRNDFAVFRPAEGNWYIHGTNTNVANLSTVVGWGTSTDKLAPADYDGDGRTDVAVYRPAEGNWYIRKSGGGTTLKQWGVSTDIIVPADYDGDRKADIAVWRASEGNWYIINSSNNSITVKSWGAGSLGDVPAPADFDGDGKADIAIWRAPEGNWYVVRSSDNVAVLYTLGVNPGDKPVPTAYIPPQ